MPPSMPASRADRDELRSHIVERVAHGRRAGGGAAATRRSAALAESYLAEVPLTLPPHGRRILAKLVDVVLIVCCSWRSRSRPRLLTALNLGEELVWLALIVSV